MRTGCLGHDDFDDNQKRNAGVHCNKETKAWPWKLSRFSAEISSSCIRIWSHLRPKSKSYKMTATKLNIIKRDMINVIIVVYQRHIYTPSVSKGSQNIYKRSQGFIIHERKQGFVTKTIKNNKWSTRSTAFICKRIPEKPQQADRSNGPQVHLTSSGHCKWNTLHQNEFMMAKGKK